MRLEKLSRVLLNVFVGIVIGVIVGLGIALLIGWISSQFIIETEPFGGEIYSIAALLGMNVGMIFGAFFGYEMYKSKHG